MQSIPSLLAVVLLAGSTVMLQAASDIVVPQKAPSSVSFNLLPRAFQKNPKVEFNIISEMTAEGRKAVHPTPANPVYYVSTPGGYVHLGQGATSKEKPPTIERMEKMLEQSLATTGYLRATPEHPPTIAIIYTWGSHSSPADDPTATADEAAATDSSVNNHILIDEMIERARLVGGEKFAAGLVKAMSDEGTIKSATGSGLTSATDPTAPPLTDSFSPIERFRNANEKNMGLLEDASHSIYFVVASAYDAASVKTRAKIILWRTKMSTNSAGIALSETIPSLVTAAAPYFGRDMSEPEIIAQRINREGNVEIGTSKVVGFGDEANPNAAAKQTPAMQQPGAKKP